MMNRSLLCTLITCGLLGSWAVAEDAPSSAQLVFSAPTEVVRPTANVEPFDYDGDGVFDLLHGGKDVRVSINKGTNQKPVCETPISILAGGKDLLNVGCLCYGGTSPQFVDWNGERAAYELYSDMAEKIPAGKLREVFTGLAREEARHKLFFESEYDERVLTDN